MLSDQVLLQSFTLFFALLNPFLLSIYLLDLITDLKTRVFTGVLAHDFVKERNARPIDCYMEVVGRISALLIGTIAIEMIMVGGGSWWREISAKP